MRKVNIYQYVINKKGHANRRRLNWDNVKQYFFTLKDDRFYF